MSSYIEISQSKMVTYQRCPKYFCYKYIEKIPEGGTDYPRMTGVVLHRFVAKLHQPSKAKDDRFFYYGDLTKARRAFINAFIREEAEKVTEGLLHYDRDMSKKFLGIGQKCLQNYWHRNFKNEQMRPLLVEKKFSVFYQPGVVLHGIIDQVRILDSRIAQEHFPQLFDQNGLLPGYGLRVPLDLKTETLSIEENSAWATPLILDKQSTLYLYLLEKTFGQRPVCFIWDYVQVDKQLAVTKGEEDYLLLFEAIDDLIDHLNTPSRPFVARDGRHCRYCDFASLCNQGRMFVSLSKEDLAASEPVRVQNAKSRPVKPRQRRLTF